MTTRHFGNCAPIVDVLHVPGKPGFPTLRARCACGWHGDTYPTESAWPSAMDAARNHPRYLSMADRVITGEPLNDALARVHAAMRAERTEPTNAERYAIRAADRTKKTI